jgi:hypothetical protein
VIKSNELRGDDDTSTRGLMKTPVILFVAVVASMLSNSIVFADPSAIVDPTENGSAGFIDGAFFQQIAE